MTSLLLLLLASTAPGPHCATPLFYNPMPAAEAAKPVTKKAARPMALGQKGLFWLQNMTVMPPQQVQAEMTCRALGKHCYVMVDDSSWNAGLVDSADVALIAERFDNSSPRDPAHGVWYHNTTNLGQPPDAVDSDSLIYLLYYNVGTFHGNIFDGFWQYFDEYYDTTSMRRWGYHSNEVECVYLDLAPNNPSSDYRMAIAAHEFGHMIHWNYDPAESLWVNEGCAELAMWLFGSPDPISGFPSGSDNDLTRWTGSWADYIKTYLYFLFLQNQYGGRVGNDSLIRNIVASPLVSIEGIDAGFEATGLPERFDGILDQWVVTNRLNDSTFAGGRYAYYGENVPLFSVAGYHTTYPVTRNGTLNRWAGEYLMFQQYRDLELTFDGADAADYRLFLVARDSINHRWLLDTLALDSLQHVQVSLPGIDTAYQTVMLVPVSHYPYGQQAYAYEAASVGIQEPQPPAPRPAALPALILSGARLALPAGTRLYDNQGRSVAAAPGAPLALPAGVYYARSGTGNAQRLTIVQ